MHLNHFCQAPFGLGNSCLCQLKSLNLYLWPVKYLLYVELSNLCIAFFSSELDDDPIARGQILLFESCGRKSS